MIPGSNLLSQALSLIRPQSIAYLQCTGRTLDAAGRDVAVYAAPVDVPRTSVQAVPLGRYAQLGLDYKRRYVTVFAPVNIVGVSRDRTGDRISYDSEYYDVEMETPWFRVDGWVEILAVYVLPVEIG